MTTSDNWGEYYPEAEEEMSPNIPKAKGEGIEITCSLTQIMTMTS